MGSTADFVQFIVDQCSGAGEITTKKNPMLESNKHVPSFLDEVIPPNLVCSQELRAFFQQHLGSDFHFKVEFQKWLKENAGKTYGDAVEAYKALQGNRK